MVTAIAAIAWIGIVAPNQSPGGPERLEVKIPGQLPSFWMRKTPPGETTVAGKKVAIPSMWVAETEATWDVYDIYAFRLDQTAEEQAAGLDAKSRPSKPYGSADRGFGHQGFAAIGITANAANQFAKWLSKKTGLKFRLPKESEWEYAARAGMTGAAPSPLDAWAWYWDNAEDQTHKVGSKKANAWGLFDTVGNVAEWATDAKGIPVVCGGSFADKSAKVGFGARKYFDPKWQEGDAHVPKSIWWLTDAPFVGVRLVCDP